MEHNYNNLHLEGTKKEKREMVHNQRPIKHERFNISNLISGFMALAIGATVLSAVTSNLKREGIIK